MFGGRTPVVGIGTVVLRTKLPSNHGGSSTHSTICLRDVLHTPSAICNIIGSPILDDYKLETSFSPPTTLVKRCNEDLAAYFDMPTKLFELKLAESPIGPVVGPSPFSAAGPFAIHAVWPDEERTRALSAPTPKFDDALTSEEKAWLRKHWRSEFHFLMAYGLKIYEEDDRAEGRLILRAMMSQDD